MQMWRTRLYPRTEGRKRKDTQSMSIEDEAYDVFYIDNEDLMQTHTEYAERSKTNWFWIVDRIHV